MKTKNILLHDELAKRLPFVAFELDFSGGDRVLSARAIECGSMFAGFGDIYDEDDEQEEQDGVYHENDLDRLGRSGLKPAVKALEDLAESFDADGRSYKRIHKAIDWLRSNY